MNERVLPVDLPLLNWHDTPAVKPSTGIRLRERAFTRMAGVMGTDPVRWIWPGWVPRNKLTLLAGYPGVGKSFVALDVLARFTARLPWPDARGRCDPAAQAPAPASSENGPDERGFLGSVPRRAVIVSSEDHPDDTISWRFASARGDLLRLVILESIAGTTSLRQDPGAEFVEAFSLDRDLHHLEALVRDWKTIDLIVVDSIPAHCDAAEREPHLKKVLTQLTRFAVAHDVAVLGIAHLRHDPAKTDIYKALGSRALASIPRTIMTVQADPADPQRRLLLPLKMNLGPVPLGLAFRFGPDRLLWDDQPIRRVASDPAPPDDLTRTMVVEAVEFLRAMLAEGDRLATELLAEGPKFGFSPRTLYRAKAALGVRSFRQGFGGSSQAYWTLGSSNLENRSER